MDTEKCRLLLTAIESGSLTAAAEKMNYTPSGISRSIAALEEELGFALLLRGRGGVSPTRECQRLLPALRELLRCEAHCRQLCGEIRGLEVGEISVGTAYFKYYPRLCGWIAAFTQKYPGIQVQIIEGRSSELSRQMELGQLDFCIISYRESRCRWIPLQEDELVILLPSAHPAAKEAALPLSFLEREPYIEIFPGQETDNSRLLQKSGIQTQTRYTTSSDEAAFAMVQAGLGATLINSLQLPQTDDSLAVLSLKPPHCVEIGIALPPAEEISPAAKRFAAFVLKQLREEMGVRS